MASKTKRTRRLTASVTEVMAFQNCRRRWYLGRMWSSQVGAPALWFGSGIHAGLEAYFKWKKLLPNDVKSQREAMLEAYDDFTVKQMERGRDEYGMLWVHAESSFANILSIGREILENYVEWDRQSALQLNPLSVERRLFIPLDAEKKNILTMRMDLIARTDQNLRAIVDHKTSGGTHATGAVLDIDEQMTGYDYGYWRLKMRMEHADLIVYDVLMKKVPEPPRRLKTGKLSAAVDQNTTIPWLMAEIEKDGDDVNRFAELLYKLETQGWTPYFNREASSRNVEQLQHYERRVQFIFAEMRAVLNDPSLAFPSPGTIRCGSCPFIAPCNAMERNEDAQYVLESAFTRESKTPWTLPARFREVTG